MKAWHLTGPMITVCIPCGYSSLHASATSMCSCWGGSYLSIDPSLFVINIELKRLDAEFHPR